MSNAAIEEPKPIRTEYSEPVLPFVVLKLLYIERDVLGADLEARAKLGVERYGTLLMTHNGRDALADLYQELLDALMYLGQYMLETEALMDFEFDRLKQVAIQVKRLMSGEQVT